MESFTWQYKIGGGSDSGILSRSLYYSKPAPGFSLVLVVNTIFDKSALS